MNKMIYLKRMMIAGATLMLAAMITAVWKHDAFFQAYLWTYLYWLGFSLGALGFSLLHQLTGGDWGWRLEPVFTSALRLLPWMALFFLPILTGMHSLFPWSHADHVAADVLLQKKAIYLNIPFFIIRSIIYFGSWILLARKLTSPLVGESQKRVWAGGGMVLYALTLSFAVYDWYLSIDPHWFSSIFPALVMVSQGLQTLALAILSLNLYDAAAKGNTPSPVKPIHDTGNLLLAFTMLWAYMAYSQYLIIFAANIPEEITWYIHRQHGLWFVVAMMLIVFQFIVPFMVLIIRRNKTALDRLRIPATILIVMRIIDVLWVIKPSFQNSVHPLDAVVFLGFGLVWVGGYGLIYLAQKPTEVSA